MKKMKEVRVCDFCEKQEDYLQTCVVCEKEYCGFCSQVDSRRFVDTCLCHGCNIKVWVEFPKLLKKLKENLKNDG